MSAYPTQSNIQTTGSSVVPIGANGAGRSKLMSASELRSAAAAYSSAQVDTLLTAYLPLAGGTLTGPITGTAGLIEQRNGITAQCFDLFETYTSGTNNGKMRFKATSSGHQIGSARSTSGSNRAVHLGHFDAAGAFTSGLSVTTSGNIVIPGTNATIGNSDDGSADGIKLTSGGINIFRNGSDFAGIDYPSYVGFKLIDILLISWSSTGAIGGAADTALGRRSAGVVEINNGTAGTLRDLVFRDITFVPSSSRTLATNGHFAIEMTSNTTGNLVYRGSDGTTRRMALTFS